MELIKLGSRTYYIKNPVNVGIFLLNENDICLIDSGNSKDSAKKISKIIDENNWNLKYIINTHSHADHIGGNKYLQEKYKCKIYGSKIESYFINTPILEPVMLFGASPLTELQNRFLLADSSECEDIKYLDNNDLEVISLKGHSIDMIGIKTCDNVLFLGDAFTSEEIIEKYKIQYIYDIDDFISTLDIIKNIKCNYYVPAHAEVKDTVINLIDINKKSIDDLEKNIIKLLQNPKTVEELIKDIFDLYDMFMNVTQYFLIGTTVKAFLTKLIKDNKVTTQANDNKVKYTSVF